MPNYLVLFMLALLPGSAFAGEFKIVSPVSLLLLQAGSSWGGELIGEESRPERTWITQFDAQAAATITVGAGESIEDALSNCPANGYCVVQLNTAITLAGVQNIGRSKTKILGLAGNEITFQNDGAGGSFFEVGSNSSEIVFENLVLNGESVNYGNNGIFGIYVSGVNIDKVAIVGNEIHNIYSDDDAHGIAIYGEGTTEESSINNILIENNHVHDLKTGSSESIAVNGNVTHWTIIGNRVEHVNNIAIDAIGGEGTVPPQTVNGRVLPHSLDAARYGFIEHNSVTDMSTVTNPSYGEEHSWAGAIYVDGGHHLYIADNIVDGSEWAYDIGAENCVVSSNIALQNNSASNSYYGDFLIGGYAATGYKENSAAGQAINCNPLTSVDANEGHGYVENVTVKNNTFNSPATPPPGEFEHTIELGLRIRQAIIIQTAVAEDHPNGLARGDENSIRVSE